MFRYNVTISEAELEPGYNHVNHAYSLNFLERARLEYLISIGCPNESFIAEGIFLVIASLQVQYKREVFSGNYEATVSEVRIDGKALLMNQCLYNERGKECIEAVFDTRFVDGKTKRSIPVPQRFIDAFSR